MKPVVNIMWFRRDLRLQDNAALYHALKSDNPVVPVFIFDKNILDDLEDKTDRRVQFIHDALQHMHHKLQGHKSALEVYYGTPQDIFKKLCGKYSVGKVFTNHDHEQYAIDRDKLVGDLLQSFNASLHTFKDQVIFEKDEVVKDNGEPYTIFTPYSRKWKSLVRPFHVKAYPVEKYTRNFYRQSATATPSLKTLGFNAAEKHFPPGHVPDQLLQSYKEKRDYPGINGTSRLGVHLRFGTISIRALAATAMQFSETFLNELIWRDFYHSILWHFPHVRMEKAFKPEYDRIRWRNNETEFEKWCNGQTGYPIVDAGMRELNATGFMHNRVRMITASFLTKHLLIDWRWGEAYFAKKLLDFDFAANNGGWQWAAGSGCDAAPYFRIFNPTLQTRKFDKTLSYIRKWVPEVDSFDYPTPIVAHEAARKRCLEVYGAALKR